MTTVVVCDDVLRPEVFLQSHPAYGIPARRGAESHSGADEVARSAILLGVHPSSRGGAMPGSAAAGSSILLESFPTASRRRRRRRGILPPPIPHFVVFVVGVIDEGVTILVLVPVNPLVAADVYRTTATVRRRALHPVFEDRVRIRAYRIHQHREPPRRRMPRPVAAPPPRRRKPRPPRRIECRHRRRRRRRHRHAHGESDRRTRRGEEAEDASSPPRSPRGTTRRGSCGVGLARGVGLGMHSIMTEAKDFGVHNNK